MADLLSPDIWINFGIAVAVGRFVSDWAFYKYRRRVGTEGPDDA